MWFDSWEGVGRVAATGIVSYALLVLLLRTSGKRTLSKLNAFDLVVTVAMGSTLASVLLSADVPVAEGAAGFLVLVVCQYLVAKLSCSFRSVARLVRSEPRLLLHEGKLLEANMQAERITRGEVLAALRQAGIGRIADTGAVVLETDGSLSVLRASDAPFTTLDGVRR